MNRLDKHLVEQGLAPTRAKAQELIKSGNVKVNGKIIEKSSFDVDCNDNIEMLDLSTLKYVSRAGLKLEKAILEFNLNFDSKNVLDIGSSTGGFTDCALQHGAQSVISVDVGTDLMHETLRKNPKVELHEQTNIKDLPSEKFKNLDFITIDVSFVSLSKIFEKLSAEKVSADIVALIKPQFECGKTIADKFKGVILNPKIHFEILTNVINMANGYGFYLQALSPSPIKGGDGNIEYISLFSSSRQTNTAINIKNIISTAFEPSKR